MSVLEDHDLTALAELVRTKAVSPVDLVEESIARIERLNPELNAIVTPMYESARASALQPSEGPLAGVPYLIKDILAQVEGVRYTAGSRLLEHHVSHNDSELIARLRRAGLIFVAKTNTPEFGFLPTTESLLFGAAKNPWGLGHTTGGSSGGSAAAVAARILPAAHANDGGGSIRIPASCCGLFGLKPTRGRISLGPDLGDVMGGLVCEHAVTVSVRDSALLLDLTQGPAAGDPYFAAPPVRPYMEEVRTPPGKLRIAVSTKTLNGVEVHPDCLAAVADAKQLCSELGHEVFDAELPISGDMFAHAFSVLWTTGAALTLDGTAMLTGLTPTKDNIEPLSYALAEAGRAHSASSYLLAVGLLQRLCREIGRFMQGHDVLLSPVLAEPPVPLGSFHQPSEDPLQGLVRAAQFAPFTPIQNATGEPAMSVPLYWNAEGLPIGVQFAGRYGDEATLFRLAAQLETARPWAKKKPKVSA